MSYSLYPLRVKVNFTSSELSLSYFKKLRKNNVAGNTYLCIEITVRPIAN